MIKAPAASSEPRLATPPLQQTFVAPASADTAAISISRPPAASLECQFDLSLVDHAPRRSLRASFGRELARRFSLRVQSIVPVHPLMTLGIIALFVGGILGYHFVESQHNVAMADTPSAAEMASYQVPADQPRLLSIGTLGITSRVSNDSVRNIHDVSWDSASAKPTDASGAVIIRGSSTVDGKSAALSRAFLAQIGMRIQLELGNRTTRDYTVTHVQSVNPSQVDAQLATDTSNSRLIIVVNSTDTNAPNSLIISASSAQ